MDRFHTNYFTEGEHPEGYMWSGNEKASKHPDLTTCGPKSGDVSRISKIKENLNCASEKPKLENARRLRGISFIDPEDKHFKEMFFNARKKFELPTPPAMPCKRKKSERSNRC